MRYPAAKQYLASLANYEKNTRYNYRAAFKPGRFKEFLKLIGNPQNSLKIIHVAGTKGKGSACVFTAYILREAGFSVGLYTSPHLVDFRERIRILKPGLAQGNFRGADFEGMIPPKEIARLVRGLKPLVAGYNRHARFGPLSFFEVYTALAFLYFKNQQVDFTVLETGLGGRLDATNAAAALVVGITPISLEHTDKLGNTLAKIAAEKSGIIKQSGIAVISSPQDPPARKVIFLRCQKFRAKLFEVGRQIKYTIVGQGASIRGLKNDYVNLRLNLIGEHQVANAALAVGMVEALSLRGFNIPASAIKRGLARAVWPGRCELIRKYPSVVLDGAQNLASARILKKAIQDHFSYRKLILILGISQDKDIAGICRCLASLADEVVLTRANTPRAAAPEQFAGYFKPKPYLTHSVKEAKILGLDLAGRQDLILITGSLFVVGEFKKCTPII